MQIKGLESFFSSLYREKILSEKVSLSFFEKMNVEHRTSNIEF